jgi:hypothetical protein
MGIKTNLNIAPYFDDYDIAKKYYRVLFKPGFAVQARELTQLQTTLQNQIEQFGENIYKEGSIVKGCTFTEIRNLKYIKVVDRIIPTVATTPATFTTPEDFVERTVVQDDGTIDEYYYEIEDNLGLKALIVQGASGFQSRAPDLNTFFVVYLNTATNGSIEKKQYEPNDTLQIREYILRTQVIDEETVENILDNGIVATTSVAGFSTPVGDSFGLNAAEGVIFQRGHFLFVDNQTIVVKKYMTEVSVEFEEEPNNISVGYVVDESIINSQQDTSLQDNANGSPNENAPGADRLLLVPRLIARNTVEAEQDAEFFILRRYENGLAVETRDVSQFNSISKELARRTFETHGDYTKSPFQFDILKREDPEDFFIEMGEGTAYSKGYRVSNDTKRLFRVPAVETTIEVNNQPINFTYGGFVKVESIAGTLPVAGFQNVALVNASLDTIGSAIVKNFVGDKVYLFGIRMNSANSIPLAFEDVRYIGSGSTGRVEIVPKIINSSESRMIFDFNRPFTRSINDLTFYARNTSLTSTDSSGDIEIAAAEGEVFDQTTLQDILIVTRSGTLENVPVVSAEILLNGNLAISTAALSKNVTVYYNSKKLEITPRTKQVLEIFVKTTFSSATQIYTLGVPDVISIISIEDINGDDFTNSFRLVKNQKDDFYDHSYIEKKPGSATPANGLMTIKLKVFRIDTSVGVNLFTVDSYNNVDLQDISYFEGQDGRVYDLKSCIDMRPYRLPISAYAETEDVATTLTNTAVSLPNSTTQLFSSGPSYLIPSVNTSASADIEYYSSRTDYIVGSSSGRFRYVTGNEAGDTRGRLDTNENTIIAEVRVPGFPVLTQEEAFRLNRRAETISVTQRTVSTYTMKDIDRISKKLQRVVYYLSMSALETSTSNLLIQDENGNNRFKNGFIVDPFTDLSIADVSDANFNASVNTSDTTLRPSITQFPLDLRFKSSTATDNIGAATTLSTNKVVRFLKQTYATNFRSCTSNVYRFFGRGAITPEYDVAYDTVTTPIELNVDFSQAFIDFTEALSEFVPMTTEQSTLLSQSSTSSSVVEWHAPRSGTNTTTTQTTQEFEDLVRELNTSAGETDSQFVGDFVTNFQFSPFIRGREVQIELFGLRPNTEHYFFFDRVDVGVHVAPGTYFEDLPAASTSGTRVARSGTFGTPVKTNEFGELFAIFNIPNETFFVGERELVVVDVSSYDDIDSASASIGKLKYNAYNFSVEKAGLTLSTRQPNITVTEERSNRSVTTRTVSERNVDPLAQTFFVKDTMAQGADAIYLSGVDLYFKRKSQINGVTIEIREVDNGYPSAEVLTFGRKHLRQDEVNVSDDGTIATAITFDGPVRLETEKEYAIAIQPDADDPDYLIYTTKPGGTDLSTGEPVNADWGDGVLFTSTNNRAWTAYQDEDIKFDLYRYNFNVNTGSVKLETTDYEFLEIGAVSGPFVLGELVYAFRGTSEYQVNLDTTSNIASGSGLTVYDQGDYLYVANGLGLKDILKVVQVISSTEIVIERPPIFTGSYQSRPVVAGKVSYFNPRKPNLLVLEKSSARENRTFVAADALTGLISEAIAPLTTVKNIELSYIQAMINRITDANTNVKASLEAIDPLFPANPAYIKEFEFATDAKFNERGCVIYSKSNDVNGSKNLKIILTLNKEDLQTTTPLIDVETAQLFAYIYNVTDDEDTTSKYISKRVELREGFDAEDFRLYVTAYRPSDTNIKAYIRIKNEADPVSLRNNDWIELGMIEGSSLFSSVVNSSDFKEYVFEIPQSQKVGGVVQYENTTGIYLGFRSFSIRIDLLSDNVGRVPKLLDYRGIAFE